MGLLTPGFLIAGVLLASIPIAIHLLNRRRYKEQTWAAMEFLLRALKENRKRLRFERWLLLAMRCLLLGLLGLALARPVGCEGNAVSALARQSGLHVIVIDDSYSMGYEAGRPGASGVGEGASGGTHLDQAKLLARRAIDRMTPGGDAVAIITVSAPARLVFPAGYDLDAARAAVDRLDQTALATDLAGALRLAERVGSEAGSQPLRTLQVLSDGTRSSLGENGTGGEALKEAAAGLPRAFTTLTFHHLGLTDQRHTAVLDLGVDTSLVTARHPARLTALARSFGGDETRTLRWLLDGQPIPGGGEVKLSDDPTGQRLEQVRFGRAGARVIGVELVGPDRLPADTVRRRVVQVADRARVLIVEGDRGAGPLGSSGAFLKLALTPPAEGDGPRLSTPGGTVSNSPLEAESVSDLELPTKVLADYRAIVLTGVAQLPEPVADGLKAYVENGGTLLTFMGEPISIENYNAVLVPRGLLPGPIAKRVTMPSEGKPFTFDFKPQGNLHPILSVLAGESRSGLDTAQTTTYLQVEPGPKVERVLNFAGSGGGSGSSGAGGGAGDPAITAHSLGGGRVVFVATSAGADGWTTINAKPVFVTLVQEMIAKSVPPAAGWMNVAAGGRLELPAGLKLSSAPTLKDAAGRTLPMLAEANGAGQTVWRSEVLTRPGLYSLAGIGAGETATLPVVVNPDAAAEADVRTVDEAAIKRALGDIEIEVLRDASPAEAAAEREDAGRGADYGWIVMAALLLGLGAESVMALKFGHGRGAAGVAE